MSELIAIVLVSRINDQITIQYIMISSIFSWFKNYFRSRDGEGLTEKQPLR